jgi:hypothetical protein
MARRAWGWTAAAIVAAWGAVAGANEAENCEVGTAVEVSDCGCVATPAPHKPRQLRDQHQAMALGWTFIALGHGLATLHAAAADRGRLTDLVPIGGPIAAIWNDHDTPGWTAALLFSAWSQAVGALVLVFVGAAPDDDPAPPAGGSRAAPAASAGLRF